MPDLATGPAVLLMPLHGLGGRQDLPLPFGVVVAGAAVAVVASFVVLGLAWRTARYADQPGLVLPRLTRLVDATATRRIIQAAGLAVAGWMAMALVFGQDLLINPIFGFLYVWVWVGLVPVSLLFGPVWRTLNPLRTLHQLVSRLLRRDPAVGAFPFPAAAVGWWPAAAGLYGFVWLELIAPERATRPVVLLWLALYVVCLLFGAVLVGHAWFEAADPFQTYATVIAHLSPWGRSRAGMLELRSPLRNLDRLRPRPGLVAVVSVLLGSTAFDGFSNSTAWYLFARDHPWPGLSTAVLTGFILLVFTTYSGAAMLAGSLSGVPRRALPGLFAGSLLPIVLGYAVAHYLTLFVLEGQRTLILASDPLSRGWDVFGTATGRVDSSLTNQPELIAALKAGAVVGGHLLGIVSAHDRALALFPRTKALVGQLPLLVVMVGYTIGGLLLLFAV